MWLTVEEAAEDLKRAIDGCVLEIIRNTDPAVLAKQLVETQPIPQSVYDGLREYDNYMMRKRDGSQKESGTKEGSNS